MAQFPVPEKTPEVRRLFFVSQTEKKKDQNNRTECRTNKRHYCQHYNFQVHLLSHKPQTKEESNNGRCREQRRRKPTAERQATLRRVRKSRCQIYC